MIQEITFSVNEVAKLTQFPGGEIKFFSWLRDKNYLQKDNQPYQKYRDRNWIIYVDKKILHEGKKIIVGVPRITIEGLAGLKKAVRTQFPICPPCNERV